MKNLYKILLILSALLVSSSPALARENVTDWYIKDLQTDIRVKADSSLEITENILADCGNSLDKHGIFRTLPKKYNTKDGNFILPIELISITDQAGKKLKYSVVSDSDTITYKIGDPDVAVIGENYYQIKYLVKNAIRTGNSNFDELYWNVLGNYWDLEIDQFMATVYFPEGINSYNTEISYYTGFLNSKVSDLADYKWVSDSVLEIKSNQVIAKKGGITLSAAFPKNIITPYQPTFKDKYGYSKTDILLFLLWPFLTFIICFYLWRKYGHDPRFNKAIVPEFEIPENLTPLEMGGIMKKGDLDKNSIAATIIRLGVLGYLKIEQVDKKIAFVNTTDFKLVNTGKVVGADLYKIEKYILDELLGSAKEVELKKISYSLAHKLPQISNNLLNDLNTRKLVGKTGKEYRQSMFFLAGLLVIVGIIWHSWSPANLGLLASAVVIFSFSFLMDKLTLSGAELKWRIKGFRLYMETAEKYRSRFQEQEGTLDKLLPYAILFGITGEWLTKLKDIYGENYLENHPASFIAGNVGTFSFNNFISTVDKFSGIISTAMIDQVSSEVGSGFSSSSSGFGGGGGAGGGGGGGGGGGW